MRKTVILALSAFGILLFANCHPKAIPTDKNKDKGADKTATKVSPEPVKYTAAQIAEGKTIYEAKCNKCHDLPIPEKYDEQAWGRILPGMVKKAKLPAENAALVKAYIMSAMAMN